MSRTHFTVPAALILVACGSADMTDLEEYVQRVQARKPGPIDPLPALAPIAPFSFAPKSRRDPFVPERRSIATATAPVGNDIVPDPLRPREELERFPLDSLAMVGTLAQGGMIRALIATPGRALFQVGVGNYMGTHNGRITRITEERIELTEWVRTMGGLHASPRNGSSLPRSFPTAVHGVNAGLASHWGDRL